jgi:hypothetical protein
MAVLRARRFRLSALLALAALSGCSLDPRSPSFLDACAALMKEAFPGGDIKIVKAEAQTQQTESIATIVVAVAGERQKVPAGGIPLRDIAVECRYTEGILSGFRWTKGPLR